MNRVQKRLMVFIASALFLARCSLVFALNPSLDISQYAHNSWTVREGFFKGPVNAIAQTPDGYLWLGTDFGLFRFDGVRSFPWQPRGSETLPSKIIRKLFVSRDGTLWIGTHNGLASWKNGALMQYREIPGRRVDTLLEDREGTIWVGVETIPTWRVCTIQNATVQCYGEDGSLGLGAGTLFEDKNGDLWAGTGTALWRWKPGPPKLVPLSGSNSEIHALTESDNGALLVSTRGGILQLNDGKATAYPIPDIGPQFNPFWLLRDREGSLWVGTKDHGLLHLHQGRTDHFGRSDGLSGDSVEDLFEDREGNVWVATGNGLDRFRDFAVPTISVAQGLSSDSVESVLTAMDGSVWLGTRDGLNRWNHGHVTLYRKKRAQPPSAVRQIIEPELPDDLQSALYGDHRGRIWVFSRGGAAYLENDHFIPVRGLPGGFAHAIAEDDTGDLWISQDQGLFHFRGDGGIQQIPWLKFGGLQGVALALVSDPSQGGLWLGFSQGGMAYFKDGQIHQSYAAANGLGAGRVNALRFGTRGTLWVATEGGLTRIKNGDVATLTAKNGLPCDVVHWSTEDHDHGVWLYMGCGLVRIERAELDAWVNEPTHIVKTTVFDNSDGVRSVALLGALSPHVGKSTDGKIWFVSGEGVSVLDPYHLSINKLPPPVHIEQITADRRNYDATNGLRLPANVRDLAINYTALSLVAPEKVHFKYKLQGQDNDWREVVNDRQVQYSNLAPKHYRFQVIASNNSGVWNEQGASLDFVIPPAWYQTNWFRALCAAAFLALLWGLYRLRVQQLVREEKKLREAMQTIPAMAFIVARDGSRELVNRRWVDYTGMRVEQATGSGWQAAVHPDDLKRVLDRWQASLDSGEPLEYEARFRRADGEYRWHLVRALPLRDKRGNILKWYGTATDIEDRKRAEQLQADLAHINRVTTMGELTASLAHEIKQPIAATVTNAQACLLWAKSDQPDMEEIREAADGIVKAGKRAADIIDRLRSLYKKAPPERELVDVNEVVREMVGLLRGEANRHAVSIRTEVADDLPRTIADRVQLQQVLMNLMLNGIEAMKDTGGVLTVKSEPGQEGRLLISVSDTGVGLPAGEADQIFRAFFTTKSQGSGMGLAISRSIIESHDGRIWATSNDGRGASFHFTLPIAVEAQIPATAP